MGSSKGGEARPKSWAQVVNTGLSYPGMELSISQADSLLCSFYKVGGGRWESNSKHVSLMFQSACVESSYLTY